MAEHIQGAGLDFRDLRYFTYVAELKSFSRAAVQLRIAQSAISRCIAQLEGELGVTLLTRHGRGVTLTEAGQTLYERAQLLLRDLRKAREDVVTTSQVPRGHLRLAVPPAAGQVLCPPVIKRYSELYPHVSLHIHEGFSGYMYEWLLTGRVDIAVMHNPTPQASLDIEYLLTEQMFVIVPGKKSAGYKNWRHAKSYGIKDLAELPLILPSRPHSLRVLMEHTAAERGVSLNVAVEADGLPIIKSLIEEGIGATVMAHVAITQEVADGLLMAVPLKPAIEWRLELASHRDRNRSIAARELLRIISEEVHELVRLGVWKGSREE